MCMYNLSLCLSLSLIVTLHASVGPRCIYIFKKLFCIVSTIVSVMIIQLVWINTEEFKKYTSTKSELRNLRCIFSSHVSYQQIFFLLESLNPSGWDTVCYSFNLKHELVHIMTCNVIFIRIIVMVRHVIAFSFIVMSSNPITSNTLSQRFGSCGQIVLFKYPRNVDEWIDGQMDVQNISVMVQFLAHMYRIPLLNT